MVRRLCYRCHGRGLEPEKSFWRALVSIFTGKGETCGICGGDGCSRPPIYCCYCCGQDAMSGSECLHCGKTRPTPPPPPKR